MMVAQTLFATPSHRVLGSPTRPPHPRHPRCCLRAASIPSLGTQSPPCKYSITLTTQCSLDRWPRFQQQAESWGGPVSVAVYIPAPQHTAAADFCLRHLEQLTEAYRSQHPGQQLHVNVLCADHFAREGASVLRESGFLTSSSSKSDALTADPADAPLASIPYEQLYPINALRNLALQQATTPVVLPADADFIFSPGLLQQLHTPNPPYSILEGTNSAAAAAVNPAGVSDGCKPEAAAGGGVGGQRTAAAEAAMLASLAEQLILSQQQQPNNPITLVLPAFQLAPQQQGQGQHGSGQQGVQGGGQAWTAAAQVVPDSQHLVVPGNKAELLAGLAAGRVRPFDCGVFAPAQQPLDLAAWCSSQVPLHLPYVDLFEVHGGVSVQQQLPSYSEAFRGYGLNKQQHAWHAAALGFRFLVLPDAFMVTAPHQRPTSWRPAPGTAADAAHLQRISSVYAAFKQSLRQQGLQPPLQ